VNGRLISGCGLGRPCPFFPGLFLTKPFPEADYNATHENKPGAAGESVIQPVDGIAFEEPFEAFRKARYVYIDWLGVDGQQLALRIVVVKDPGLHHEIL